MIDDLLSWPPKPQRRQSMKDLLGDEPFELPPGARNTDPETSHQAASKNASVRAHDRRAVLLAHIANPAGLTDFELAEIVGRQQTSAGKRRGELRDVAMIEQTDERRPAPSGSMAIVWRVTPMGREAAEGAA